MEKLGVRVLTGAGRCGKVWGKIRASQSIQNNAQIVYGTSGRRADYSRMRTALLSEKVRGKFSMRLPPMLAACCLWCAIVVTAVTLASSSGAVAQSPAPQCAPGKQPLCLCACVAPDPRHCETLPSQMPSPAAIRSHLALYLTTEAPPAVANLASQAAGWSDTDLGDAYASALVAARCHSGGQPGPINPAQIPAAEVKSWVLAVLADSPPSLRALSPIVATLPAPIVRIGYLRAVELRRGLDFGSEGK